MNFGYEYDEFAPYEMKRNNTLSEKDVHNIHLAEEILERYWNAHRMDYTMNYLVDQNFSQSPFAFMQQFWARTGKSVYSWIKYQLSDLFTRLYDYLETLSLDKSLNHSLIHEARLSNTKQKLSLKFGGKIA